MPLEFARVPQILDMLVEQQVMTPEQKGMVVDDIKAGKKGAAGELAVERGFATREQLMDVLQEQVVRKAEAAVLDIQQIAIPAADGGGTQDKPAWLTTNWGNSGVNQPSADPSVQDGISAAANMAQHIVILANDNPEIAAEMKPAIAAAANLARGMRDGPSVRVPIDRKADEWQEALSDGLRKAVERTGHQCVDKQGQPVSVEDYISARTTEISAGAEKSIAQAQGRGKAGGHGGPGGG